MTINKYSQANKTYNKSTFKIQVQDDSNKEICIEEMSSIIDAHKSTVAEATAGTDDTTIMTPLKVKSVVDTANNLKMNKTFGANTGGKVLLSRGQTGIENVESTIDQTTLEGALDTYDLTQGNIESRFDNLKGDGRFYNVTTPPNGNSQAVVDAIPNPKLGDVARNQAVQSNGQPVYEYWENDGTTWNLVSIDDPRIVFQNIDATGNTRNDLYVENINNLNNLNIVHEKFHKEIDQNQSLFINDGLNVSYSITGSTDTIELESLANYQTLLRTPLPDIRTGHLSFTNLTNQTVRLSTINGDEIGFAGETRYDLQPKESVILGLVFNTIASQFNNLKGYVIIADSKQVVIPAIPTNVSQLNNDAGYITASAITNKQDKTSTTSISKVNGNATTSQIIRTTDQTVNSDLNVDSLFSVAPTKNATGQIILPTSTAVENSNGTVNITDTSGNQAQAIRDIAELTLKTTSPDATADLIPIFESSTNTIKKISKNTLVQNEVLYNNGALSGAVPAGKELGIDTATGTFYFKNASGNWQQQPVGTTVNLIDNADGTLTINAGLGGTQTTTRPTNELTSQIPTNTNELTYYDGTNFRKTTFGALPTKDYWLNTANQLPDGTTDFTENIKHDGFVGVRIDPTSTSHINGSVAHKVTFTSNATALTLDDTYYALELGNGVNGKTINLPNATTCKDREYLIYFGGDSNFTNTVIINSLGGVIGNINGVSGSVSSYIMNRQNLMSIKVKSDGTNWHCHDWNDNVKYYSTQDYSYDNTRPFTTFVAGGGTNLTGQINSYNGYQVPAIENYVVVDGNYTANIITPASKTPSGYFSVWVNNSAGFNTTIQPNPSNDLSQPLVVLSGQGRSVHFLWSNGRWVWIPRPVNYPTSILTDVLANSTATTTLNNTLLSTKNEVIITQTVTDSQLLFGGTQTPGLANSKFRVINSESSTHKLSYFGYDILPNQFVDFENNGRFWQIQELGYNSDNQLESAFTSINSGTTTSGTFTAVTTPDIGLQSSTTQWAVVPNLNYVATADGELMIKYIVYASCSSALANQTSINNGFRVVVGSNLSAGTVLTTNPLIGRVVPTSEAILSSQTANEINIYTRYVKVKVKAGDNVQVQMNSLIGSQIVYQTPARNSRIEYAWVSRERVSGRTSLIGTAQVNTLIQYDDLQFRYSANATNGNLEVSSMSATAVTIRWYGEERYANPFVNGDRSGALTVTAPATGTWTTLNYNGSGLGELAFVYIMTPTNYYKVDICNFGNTQIHLSVTKLV
jgi:hypothetical protein